MNPLPYTARAQFDAAVPEFLGIGQQRFLIKSLAGTLIAAEFDASADILLVNAPVEGKHGSQSRIIMIKDNVR